MGCSCPQFQLLYVQLLCRLATDSGWRIDSKTIEMNGLGSLRAGGRHSEPMAGTGGNEPTLGNRLVKSHSGMRIGLPQGCGIKMRGIENGASFYICFRLLLASLSPTGWVEQPPELRVRSREWEPLPERDPCRMHQPVSRAPLPSLCAADRPRHRSRNGTAAPGRERSPTVNTRFCLSIVIPTMP